MKEESNTYISAIDFSNTYISDLVLDSFVLLAFLYCSLRICRIWRISMSPAAPIFPEKFENETEAETSLRMENGLRLKKKLRRVSSLYL